MNLPNTLTLGRIFLVPLLVVVLLTKFEGKELVGAAIFALASATDWLDGYLARRNKQVTTLGQLLDPLADKLLITAALVSLVQMDLAPAWMVAVILGREFAVTVLRSLAHARGVVIAASPLGKFKMVSQVTAILALILGRDHLQQFFILGTVALWVAVLTAVVSGIDYYRKFSHVLRGTGDGVPVQGSGFKVHGFEPEPVAVRRKPDRQLFDAAVACVCLISSIRFCAFARYSLCSNSFTRRS